MKGSIAQIALLVLAVMAASALNAEVVTDATVGSGYQGNLFNDSNSTGDLVTTVGFDMKYYPSASTRFVAGAQYSAFAELGDLSNLAGDLSFTVIPTAETSPFSLALSGRMALRKFGELYELYNQVGGTAGADLTWRLTPSVRLLSAVSYLSNSYTNSDFGSYRSLDFAAGLNLTLLGPNTLAFTVDYSRRSYDQPSLAEGSGLNSPDESRSEPEALDIVSANLRFSRPLGQRTGLNLTVGNRRLQTDNDYTVAGYTIDYLSPWADLWEGTSFSGGLKHFFPRQITTEFSFAYTDKSFVDVIELADDVSGTYRRESRDDRLTALSLTASRPVLLRSGKQLVPSLLLGYRHNRSTADLFDYEDLSASISLKIGL